MIEGRFVGFQGHSIVFQRVSEGLRSVLGIFKGFHERSLGFKGVSGAFQEVSCASGNSMDVPVVF